MSLKPTTSPKQTTQISPKTTPSIVNNPKTSSVSVASEILGTTMMIGGFLISKNIF